MKGHRRRWGHMKTTRIIIVMALLIASGLARYGFPAMARRLLSALFDASTYFDLRRMPELFCGFPRREDEGPTLYPVACAPQAWAAGSVFLLLSAWLTDDQFFRFGWRIPFLASALLVIVGLYVRLAIVETPVFQQAVHRQERVKLPMAVVLREYPKTLFFGTMVALTILSSELPAASRMAWMFVRHWRVCS